MIIKVGEHEVLVDQETVDALQGTRLYADADGYIRVGGKRLKRLHRFVMDEVFQVPRPVGTDRINHIDENRLNCQRSNLEWTNASKNSLTSKNRPQVRKYVRQRGPYQQTGFRTCFRVLSENVAEVREAIKKHNLGGNLMTPSVLYKFESKDEALAQRVLDILLPIAQAGAAQRRPR